MTWARANKDSPALAVGVGGERLLSGVVEGGGGGVLALRGGVQQEPVECVEELGLALVELGVAFWRLVASVGERGGAGVHDVREGGLEEGPAADAVDGVVQAVGVAPLAHAVRQLGDDQQDENWGRENNDLAGAHALIFCRIRSGRPSRQP